ncbi:MAG: dephospho-CoA kinase [Peptococcaceae bacterium]
MALVIGLTGGIACGKSTVSAYLRQKGISVIDADLVAREVVEPGTMGLQQIKEVFGWQYICPDGTLNRQLLGKKVFADPEALQQLNAIMKPLILEQLQLQIEDAQDVVVLDAPLLLEDEQYHQLADIVWVVTAAPAVQLERLMQRNGYGRQQAQERIDAQMTEQQRLAYADGVIQNNGSILQMQQQVDGLLHKVLSFR